MTLPIGYSIKSIIPGTGWVAVYKEEGRKEDKMVAVVAWAIIRTGDAEEIVGMVAADNSIVEARSLPGLQTYAMLTDGKPLKIHY